MRQDKMSIKGLTPELPGPKSRLKKRSYGKVVLARRRHLVVQGEVGVYEVRLVGLEPVDFSPLVIEQGDGTNPKQQNEDNDCYLADE